MSDYVRKINITDSEIQTPVDIQGQYIILVVKQVKDMLAYSKSATIAAGGSGNIDITVPSGEIWEIRDTNQDGSGADISLDAIYVSPDGGSTFILVSTSHLSNHPIYVSEDNIIRASFSNSGTSDETAVFNVIGRKLYKTI